MHSRCAIPTYERVLEADAAWRHGSFEAGVKAIWVFWDVGNVLEWLPVARSRSPLRVAIIAHDGPRLAVVHGASAAGRSRVGTGRSCKAVRTAPCSYLCGNECGHLRQLGTDHDCVRNWGQHHQSGSSLIERQHSEN